jgi:hypothetical protein
LPQTTQMTSQPPLPRVDGRQCPASSECCPACLGSLSGLRRIAVRNRSETLSAFPECAPSWLAGREACGARANIVRSQTFVFGRHRGRDANDLCAAPGLSAKAGHLGRAHRCVPRIPLMPPHRRPPPRMSPADRVHLVWRALIQRRPAALGGWRASTSASIFRSRMKSQRNARPVRVAQALSMSLSVQRSRGSP